MTPTGILMIAQARRPLLPEEPTTLRIQPPLVPDLPRQAITSTPTSPPSTQLTCRKTTPDTRHHQHPVLLQQALLRLRAIQLLRRARQPLDHLPGHPTEVVTYPQTM
jgi:hypothetical protein